MDHDKEPDDLIDQFTLEQEKEKDGRSSRIGLPPSVVRVRATPNREEALQFCQMLFCGMPSMDAIRYFLPTLEDGWTEEQVRAFHDRWVKGKEIGPARKIVEGKEWSELTPEERIKRAIDKHYTEMAYFLYSTNYASIQGADKTKADTCRGALEAKLAGMAGKLDPLSKFFEDVASGRVKLASPRA